MKLLHITTVPITLYFFSGQIGYLKNKGFQIQAISSPEPDLEIFGRQEKIKVHGVPMKRQIAPVDDLFSLQQLIRLLKKQKPDIVHSHTPKAGLLGTLAAKLTGTRCIFLSIFGLAQMTKTGTVKHLLDATTRLSCAMANRVWCDSFSMRAHIIKEGLCSPRKLVVLGNGSVNGIDGENTFNPGKAEGMRGAIRDRYNIPENALVIGFVGRLVADKGLHELTTAWKLLREEFPQVHLLLVGPFEEKDPLRPADQLLLKNDPRVHLAGWRRDIPEHLAAMDLFVNPSYREGFGVANLEASSMGIPVVATRIPGCVDSVQDEVTGTLVPVRDWSPLAAAIREYIIDEGLRRRHGAAGRSRVLKDFRPEDLSEALYQAYNQVLFGSPR